MEIAPPLPTRIKWEINDDLVKTIDEAYSDGLKLIKVICVDQTIPYKVNETLFSGR